MTMLSLMNHASRLIKTKVHLLIVHPACIHYVGTMAGRAKPSKDGMSLKADICLHDTSMPPQCVTRRAMTCYIGPSDMRRDATLWWTKNWKS